MKRLLMGMVRFYRRFISPLHPPVCRFRPTCSAYALEALEVHGAFKGTWLTFLRLMRCHPLCEGGFDPVPPPKGKSGGNGARPMRLSGKDEAPASSTPLEGGAPEGAPDSSDSSSFDPPVERADSERGESS